MKRPWTSTAKSTSPSPWTRWNPKSCLSAAPKAAWKSKSSPATDPDKIVTVRVDIAEGLGGYHVNNLTYGMGLSGDLGKQVGAVVRGLYQDLPRL